jgi:hypothetical protein
MVFLSLSGADRSGLQYHFGLIVTTTEIFVGTLRLANNLAGLYGGGRGCMKYNQPVSHRRSRQGPLSQFGFAFYAL